MRQRLASSDISVEELLSGRWAFSIPAYQRDYAWTSKEALQLVDDIAAVVSDVERDETAVPYFLGTMLLVTPAVAADSPSAEDGTAPMPADVVDGQQRLITLVILFCVLRDLGAGDGDPSLDRLVVLPGGGDERETPRRYHLQLRSADAEHFRSAIQDIGASHTRPSTAALAVSQARRNIEEVRRTLQLRFQRDMNAEERRRIVAFLRTNARVLVVSSDDLDYAYQIFLTINERGKRLSVEDIFRGEILGPLDHEQRRRYEPVIEEMNKYMDAAEQQRAKGKTFFSHLAQIHGWQRGIIVGLKRAVEQRGGPRRFAAEVFSPMAEVYLQTKGSPAAMPLAAEVEHRLELLRWLERHGDDDWVPAAMLLLARLRDEPTSVAGYLTALDRFAHGLMTLGCGRDARRKHYTPVLRRLSSDDPLTAPEELFKLKTGDQALILHRIATRLHQVDPATAKLVLLRTDQSISGRPLSDYRPLMDAARSPAQRFTVEHVCPKGELAEGEWLELFPRKIRRVAAAQCIGNLALVTEAQNKRASQDGFEAKKRVFFADPAPSPLHLTEMLRHEAIWDGAAIARRYDLIMATVKSMWSLEGPIPKCPAIR